jgi:hypothetical protein
VTKPKSKTWLIESGEYSDYRVHAVFVGTEAEVKKVVAIGNQNTDRSGSDGYGYSEATVLTATSKPEDLVVTSYALTTKIQLDGTVGTTRESLRREVTFDLLEDYGTRAHQYTSRSDLDVFTRDSDLERARKAHSERVAQERARLLGMTS